MKKIKCIVLLIISIFVFSILFILDVKASSSINEEEYANRLEVVEELFDEDNNEYNKKKEEADQIISSVGGTIQNNSKYVYITLDASKYHEAGCDYLDGRPAKVSLEWAIENGYGACKYCKPYVTSEISWWNNNIFIMCCIVIVVIFLVLVIIKKRSSHSNTEKFNIK